MGQVVAQAWILFVVLSQIMPQLGTFLFAVTSTSHASVAALFTMNLAKVIQPWVDNRCLFVHIKIPRSRRGWGLIQFCCSFSSTSEIISFRCHFDQQSQGKSSHCPDRFEEYFTNRKGALVNPQGLTCTIEIPGTNSGGGLQHFFLWVTMKYFLSRLSGNVSLATVSFKRSPIE
jgi:hypothetical protein